jgi:SP family sugar:H+ symporter-like MFS transporter
MAIFTLRPADGAASTSVLPSLLIGAFVSLGGILFGYDTGTIAGIQAMPFWIQEMATETDSTGAPIITSGQISLIVSILSAGTFFGTCLVSNVTNVNT